MDSTTFLSAGFHRQLPPPSPQRVRRLKKSQLLALGIERRKVKSLKEEQLVKLYQAFPEAGFMRGGEVDRFLGITPNERKVLARRGVLKADGSELTDSGAKATCYSVLELATITDDVIETWRILYGEECEAAKDLAVRRRILAREESLLSRYHLESALEVEVKRWGGFGLRTCCAMEFLYWLAWFNARRIDSPERIRLELRALCAFHFLGVMSLHAHVRKPPGLAAISFYMLTMEIPLRELDGRSPVFLVPEATLKDKLPPIATLVRSDCLDDDLQGDSLFMDDAIFPEQGVFSVKEIVARLTEVVERAEQMVADEPNFSF